MKSLASVMVGLALCSAGVAQAALTESVTRSLNLSVPDGIEGGVGETFTFTSAIHGIVPNATWSGLKVQLQIAGGYNGDLYVLLEHGPNFAVLVNRPGRTGSNDSGYGDAGLDVVFDDLAPTGDIHSYRNFIDPLSGPVTGTWQPDGRDVDPVSCVETDPRTAILEDLVNGDPNGDWSLTVIDDAGGDQATLVSWGLEFAYRTPPEIEVHSGSDASAPSLTSGQATAVDFGVTAAGLPIARDFTIANTGNDSLTLTAVAVPAGFLALNLPTLPITLDAQAVQTFSIVLTAVTGGVNSGTVSLSSNDADEATFSFPITGIVDSNAPQITTCPAPRSLPMPGDVGPALPDLTGELVATDVEPGSLTVEQSPAAGTLLSPGDTTVAFTVRDQAGNSSTCQTVISVVRLPIPGADFSDTIRDIPATLRAEKLLANDRDPLGQTLTFVEAAVTSSQGGTVANVAGVITYTPPASFVGTDTFTYRLSAGGREATGTVTVRVRSSNLVPSNAVYVRAATLPATGMELRFAGLPGRSYSVQFTQDLQTGWTELARVTAQTPSGFVDYHHADPPSGQGFYRCLPAQ